MRRIQSSLIALAGLALVAAACGSGETGTTAAAPEPTAATEAAAEPTAATEAAAEPTTTAAAPVTTAAAEEEAAPVRMAFIYDGQADDGGWNQAYEAARQYVVAEMGDRVEATFVEDVSPGAETQAALEDFAEQGYDIVICTTYCQDDFFAVTPGYPDTIFLSWAGWSLDEEVGNVGHYDAATEDGRYLDGLAAGSQPGVEMIGYVAGFAIEEVVRGLNIFTQAARELNPDVEVRVVWINSWFDPPAEQQAAQTLVDLGADLLAAEVNAPAVAGVAEDAGIPYVHYGVDGSPTGTGIAPNSWLSGFTFNWGPYFLAQAEAVAAGTWEPAIFYGGFKDDMIDMAPFGPTVPEDVLAMIAERRSAIVDGSFDYFAGPIYDNQGNVAVPEGGTVPWNERTACCQWLIEGVIGEIPSS